MFEIKPQENFKLREVHIENNSNKLTTTSPISPISPLKGPIRPFRVGVYKT